MLLFEVVSSFCLVAKTAYWRLSCFEMAGLQMQGMGLEIVHACYERSQPTLWLCNLCLENAGRGAVRQNQLGNILLCNKQRFTFAWIAILQWSDLPFPLPSCPNPVSEIIYRNVSKFHWHRKCIPVLIQNIRMSVTQKAKWNMWVLSLEILHLCIKKNLLKCML